MQEFLREPNNTQITQFVLNHFPDTPGNTQAQKNEAYFQRISDIKESLQQEFDRTTFYAHTVLLHRIYGVRCCEGPVS